ncbi:MAG: SDR family oxidoreductase [bacterium]
MKIEKKVILLTGGTGYLGGNILKELVKNSDYNIVILKRSFSNTKK